jgi:hypothetical protein
MRCWIGVYHAHTLVLVCVMRCAIEDRSGVGQGCE